MNSNIRLELTKFVKISPFMKRYLFMVFFVMYSQASYAEELCQKEKDRVDYWNDVLKNRSTERGRDGHREAKKDFLECLREDTENQKTNNTIAPKVYSTQITPTRSNNSVSSKSRNKNQSSTYSRRLVPTKNIRVQEFAAFKGVKLNRWREFFIESEICQTNRGDMSLFVKCAEERKRHLTAFNSRWDANIQGLRPLLDP
jgi:hypothetical protein